MQFLLKYFRLYFKISLVLVMLGVIVIGMSAVADFHEYTAYPIFEQQPYFLVILQFIAQTMSSLKAMFGSLTACCRRRQKCRTKVARCAAPAVYP